MLNMIFRMCTSILHFLVWSLLLKKELEVDSLMLSNLFITCRIPDHWEPNH